MAILKALPGSAKVNGEPVKGNQPIKGKLIGVKKSVININKFLDRKKEQTKKQNEDFEKQNQNFKRKKKEERLEEPKKEWKKLVPKKVPGLSFFDSIKKFVSGWILGFVAIKLIPLLPSLIPVVINLGKMVNFIINIGGAFLNGVISFVNFGVKAQEATFGFLKNLGGEKFAENFAKFGGLLQLVLDGMLILGGLMLADALSGDSGFGLGDILGKKGLGKFFGKKAAATTTAKTAAAVTAKVGGVSAGVAAGAIAAAGAVAVGLGEGIFALGKKGYAVEEDWRKKADEKWWSDPRKYWWGIGSGILGIINRGFSLFGGILDIVGAPFRMIAELMMFPFLGKEGQEKQRDNLVKYDTRIREQFRKFANMFDIFGMVSDDEGSWGSIYGKTASEKASKEMGFTKDGKTKSQQDAEKTQKTFKVENGIVVGGTGTQEEYENIKKIQKLEDEADFAAEQGDWKKYDLIQKQISILEGSQKTSQVVSKKPQGLMRGLTGAADFVTGGIFDFDNQNRKGAPKDFGIRRIAGGLADYVTLGLTDFDKRGKGNLQVNPIGGGKDKAWGAANVQAKRGEKQSGMGIKRGIGGALDFATLGMFDFDKQNRKGAPKGFGIKRIAGGLADAITAGATDFDKRGTGIGQMKLGEMMSNKKARKAFKNNVRVRNFMNRGDELYDKFNQLPMETTVNPDGSITSKGSGKLIGGELFTPDQPLTERQYSAVKFGRMMDPNKKYSDDVLRSYAMYEEQQGSSNLKLGKQPVKFDEELLGVSASYEIDGGQKEYTIYAPTTQINMLPADNSGQLVTSGASASSGDDPYEILEKGN